MADVTKTLKTSAGDYTSVADAWADYDTYDYTDGANGSVEIECHDGTYTADTTIAPGAGYTVSATKYLTFRAVTKALSVSPGSGAVFKQSSSHIFTVSADRVRFVDMELDGSAGGTSDEAFRLTGNGVNLHFIGLRIHGGTTTQQDGFYAHEGFGTIASPSTANIWNCFIYNWQRAGIHLQYYQGQQTTQTWNIFNTTVWGAGGGSDFGIYIRSQASSSQYATINVKNCAIESWGEDSFSQTDIDINIDDTVNGDDPSTILAACSIIESNSLDSKTFTDVTTGSAAIFDDRSATTEDPAPTDHANNLLLEHGSDLTEFTDDALGTSRPSGYWDAGCIQTSTAPAAAFPPELLGGFSPRARRKRKRARWTPPVFPVDLLAPSGTTNVNVTGATLTLGKTDVTVTLATNVAVGRDFLGLFTTPAVVTLTDDVAVIGEALALTPTNPTVTLTTEVTVIGGSLALSKTDVTVDTSTTTEVTVIGVALTLGKTDATISLTDDVAVIGEALTLGKTDVTVDTSTIVEVTVIGAALTLGKTDVTIGLADDVTVIGVALTLGKTDVTISLTDDVAVIGEALALSKTDVTIGLADDVAVIGGALTLGKTDVSIGTDLVEVDVVGATLTLGKTDVTVDLFSVCPTQLLTPLEIPAAQAFYMGDPDTAGSWRFVRSGNDLVIQRLESSLWVTKTTVLA